MVALNLFRAQKNSSRAKQYRGRGYKDMAYDRKQWSMGNLCRVLGQHAEALGLPYGWKQDPGTLFDDRSSWVLYVDLPEGQVSFHSPVRGGGPDYPGEFCGEHRSTERILAYCDRIFQGAKADGHSA